MNQIEPSKSKSPLLGGLIRQRRKKLSMTMQDLATTAGVSVGYVSQIERDMAVPSLGTLAQIADALSVEVEYFVKSNHQRHYFFSNTPFGLHQ